MAATPELSSIHIYERDEAGEVLLAWVYPKVEQSLKTFLTNRCILSSKEEINDKLKLNFGHYKNTWFYIKKYTPTDNSKVNHVYIAVCSQDFNPEFYSAFIDVVGTDYKGCTTDVLSQYLSLFTKGHCIKNEEKQVCHTDFDAKKAYLNVDFKGFLSNFGMESILIFTGLLLKKRIVVYSPKFNILLDICRTLPCLVFHRLNWNIVYPFNQINDEELSHFKSQRTYIAGFTDASIENRTDLFDLFVNVQDHEIIINPDSKEYFHMGKMHKEIAKFLLHEAESDSSDQDIIKALTKRTLDILSNLKSLDEENPDNPQISLQLLQSRSFTNAMQTFLYNLASAEGYVTV